MQGAVGQNDLKRRLHAGEAAVGSWLSVAHPTVAEVMGQAGFEWLIVDMEHGIIGIEGVLSLVLAICTTPAAPLVRVPWNEPVIIKRVLETGPAGLLIPQINSARDVEMAIRSARYPPQGIRGIGCQRAAGFGAWFEEYLDRANEQLLVAVQVETASALQNLDEILSVEGLDLIFIGANDLSASMGFFNKPGHPCVQEAIDQVLAAARHVGVPVGLMASDVDDAKHRIQQGFQFVGVGSDVGLLSSLCRDICRRIKGLT